MFAQIERQRVYQIEFTPCIASFYGIALRFTSTPSSQVSAAIYVKKNTKARANSSHNYVHLIFLNLIILLLCIYNVHREPADNVLKSTRRQPLACCLHNYRIFFPIIFSRLSIEICIWLVLATVADVCFFLFVDNLILKCENGVIK